MKPVKNETDAELVASLNRGDRKSFELIYRTYASVLYRFIRKNISVKEDCEEIIQEVFESLWARQKCIKIEVSLQAYLLGMARHKTIHYFQKNSRNRKYAEHYRLFEAVYEQTEGSPVDHSAIEATLNKLLTDLPERCQTALKLRLSENLSNRDIAKRMNITVRTVEAYMFRAFSHIRTSYHQYVSKQGEY